MLLDVKGDLRDHIVDYVEDLGGAVDLLVMGTRGMRGNPQRAVLGSVSSYCLALANCPVLACPGDVAREAAGPDLRDGEDAGADASGADASGADASGADASGAAAAE